MLLSIHIHIYLTLHPYNCIDQPLIKNQRFNTMPYLDNSRNHSLLTNNCAVVKNVEIRDKFCTESWSSILPHPPSYHLWHTSFPGFG